jgi:hypothetical protein
MAVDRGMIAKDASFGQLCLAPACIVGDLVGAPTPAQSLLAVVLALELLTAVVIASRPDVTTCIGGAPLTRVLLQILLGILLLTAAAVNGWLPWPVISWSRTPPGVRTPEVLTEDFPRKGIP